MKRTSALVIASLLVLAGCGSESTPRECIAALDAADRLHDTIEEYMTHTQAGAIAGADALQAAADRDAAGIDAASDAIDAAAKELAKVAPRLGQDRGAYESAAGKCRSSR